MGIILLRVMKAKKRLGQNFLIDDNIINKIIMEITAKDDDLIIEIGPGTGALTKKLQTKNANLICYELDTDLKDYLTSLENNKTRIIYQDFLKSNIIDDIKDIIHSNLYIVGNLPYYITTPIIEHIIDLKIEFKKLVIMVQKEVADRFMAKPKTKEYGYMTLVIDYYFKPKKVCNVSKKSFIPMPNVESTVLSLELKTNIHNIDTQKYFTFLKECFKQKRKTLKNNLSSYNWSLVKEVLDKYGYLENARAEELPQELFIAIYKKLFD